MRKYTLEIAVVVAIGIFSLCSLAFAVSFGVGTTVPQATDVSVTLSKIDSKGTTDPSDDTWTTPAPGGSIDFGTLTLVTVTNPLDPNNPFKQYVPADDGYYAADVGVNGAGPWRIDHTVAGAALTGSGTSSLGDNIVVTFVKQTNATAATTLDQVVIKDSTKSYTSLDLAGGWLRIYYGIVTDPAGITGASVITVSEDAGTSAGTVTISLVAL